MLYLLMILAGIILIVRSIRKKRKKTQEIPIVTPPDEELPKEKIVKIAQEVQHIYSYSEAEERKMQNVWVCKECELENRDGSECCSLCGALRY